MLRKLRQSKWVTLSLFTALVAVFFCQHCEYDTAHHEEEAVLASADTCCEPVLCAEEESEAHHDHGGCEFEVHSHDFSISIAKTYVPVIRVVTTISYDESAPVAQSARATRSMHPKSTGGPLQTLNCVRLLI